MANYSDSTILAVWEKAHKVNGVNSDEWRKDYAGAWINFKQRGGDLYGWDIDHQKPVKSNGSDDIDNLIPLHWENNRYKADKYPQWQTCISSENNKNIPKIQTWHV
jgi:hypothetical protein